MIFVTVIPVKFSTVIPAKTARCAASCGPRRLQIWHRQGGVQLPQRRRAQPNVLVNPRRCGDPASPFHLQSPRRHVGILREPRPERDSRSAEKEPRHSPRGRNRPPRQTQGDCRVRRLRGADGSDGDNDVSSDSLAQWDKVAMIATTLGRVDICARGSRSAEFMGRRANGVPNPLDSRFRGNDGVEIGNGGGDRNGGREIGNSGALTSFSV